MSIFNMIKAPNTYARIIAKCYRCDREVAYGTLWYPFGYTDGQGYCDVCILPIRARLGAIQNEPIFQRLPPGRAAGEKN